MNVCVPSVQSPYVNIAPWQVTFNLWQKSSTVTPDWHLWNVTFWSLPSLPSPVTLFFFKLIAHLLCLVYFVYVYFGLILLFTAALRPFHCLSASWYYNSNTQVLGLQFLFIYSHIFQSSFFALDSFTCFFLFLTLLKLTFLPFLQNLSCSYSCLDSLICLKIFNFVLVVVDYAGWHTCTYLYTRTH